MTKLLLVLGLVAFPAFATVEVVERSLSGDVTVTDGGVTTIGAKKVTPAMTAVADGKVVIGGASGAGAEQTLTGDVTTTNAGVTSIGAKKVTAAKTALADGKVLIGGAGGAAAEQTLSGDVTVTNAGVTAIGSGKVTQAMQAAQAVGLNSARVAIGLFDPSANVGERTVAAHAITGMTLPAKAILISICVDPLTTFDSATSAAVLAYGLESASDFGVHAVTDLVSGVAKCLRPNEVIKSTTARTISVSVVDEALTAGKMYVIAEYVQGF